VRFVYPECDTRAHLLPHEPLDIHVRYRSDARVDDVMCGLGIHDSTGRLLFGSNSKFVGVAVPPIEGEAEVVFRFPSVPLLGGDYLVSFAIQSYDETVTYDWTERRHQIAILPTDRSHGVVGFELSVEVTP
jgi:hypothetical protein